MQEKRFKARIIKLGTESRVVNLELNGGVASRIPPAIRARVDSLEAAMLAGRYTVTLPPDSTRRP